MDFIFKYTRTFAFVLRIVFSNAEKYCSSPLFGTMIISVLGIFLLMVSGTEGKIDDGLWISATVNETLLELDTTNRKVYSITSYLACLSLAGFLDWAWLACFSTSDIGKECQIWSAKDIIRGDGKLSGTAGTDLCKIKKGFYRKFYNVQCS